MAKQSLLLILLLNLVACSNNQSKTNPVINKEDQSSKMEDFDTKKISGEWMRNCNGEAGNIIIFETLDTAMMEISSNQIEIGAKIQIRSVNNEIELSFRLIEPYDLGSGGGTLDWNNFSKDSVIAKMIMIDSTHANLTWYGFFDKKLKKRIWVDGFDILTDDNGDRLANHVIIKKCEDFKFSK